MILLEVNGKYYLNDDSVHLTVLKHWDTVEESKALFLVDKTDVAEDPNAITQSKLESLDASAPRYWTSLEEVSVEEDTHDHIAFALYDDQQLVFTPLVWEKGTPITWLVEPGLLPVNLEVWLVDETPQVLRTYSALPFSLVVSKYPIEGDPRGLAAPQRYHTLPITWGEMKQQ